MASSEDMEDVQPTGTKRPSMTMDNLKRKKFKTDDLPLSAAQHAAIDKLLHSFKKKGGFDSIRKQIWAEFNGGVCQHTPHCLKSGVANSLCLAGIQDPIYGSVDRARRV